MDNILRRMDFNFFGKSLHKTTPSTLLNTPDAVFVDVRSNEERRILPIELPGAANLHIPLHELPDRWNEIPEDRSIGLFCSSDTRATIAFMYLRTRGYTSARIVLGGYETLVAELKPGKLFKLLSAGA